MEWILDTHPHAIIFLRLLSEAKDWRAAAIGAKVKHVQKLWQEKYNWPDFKTTGSQWDHLLKLARASYRLS